jgi:hypothetical protein
MAASCLFLASSSPLSSSSKTRPLRFLLLALGLRRLRVDHAMWRSQSMYPGTASFLQRQRFPSFRVHLAGSAAVPVPCVAGSESGFCF